MGTSSDHAARAPSERAEQAVRRLMRENNFAYYGWEVLRESIGKELDRFARSARKQALEDAARVAENRIRREAERTHVAAAIRALAQEEAP